MPIRIGRDVWVGSGSCILPGVTIGDGAVIGANSVVTQNIPPHSVVAGIPAHIVKKRGTEVKRKIFKIN
jgi:acetyltransferase-like isoleucine patch superfamily enzyme